MTRSSIVIVKSEKKCDLWLCVEESGFFVSSQYPWSVCIQTACLFAFWPKNSCCPFAANELIHTLKDKRWKNWILAKTHFGVNKLFITYSIATRSFDSNSITCNHKVFYANLLIFKAWWKSLNLFIYLWNQNFYLDDIFGNQKQVWGL